MYVCMFVKDQNLEEKRKKKEEEKNSFRMENVWK